MVDKKEYILEARNTGKILGHQILKIYFDDERLTGDDTVNCQVQLSDNDFEVKKGDKIKVTLEKLM